MRGVRRLFGRRADVAPAAGLGRIRRPDHGPTRSCTASILRPGAGCSGSGPASCPSTASSASASRPTSTTGPSPSASWLRTTTTRPARSSTSSPRSPHPTAPSWDCSAPRLRCGRTAVSCRWFRNSCIPVTHGDGRESTGEPFIRPRQPLAWDDGCIIPFNPQVVGDDVFPLLLRQERRPHLGRAHHRRHAHHPLGLRAGDAAARPVGGAGSCRRSGGHADHFADRLRPSRAADQRRCGRPARSR